MRVIFLKYFIKDAINIFFKYYHCWSNFNSWKLERKLNFTGFGWLLKFDADVYLHMNEFWNSYIWHTGMNITIFIFKNAYIFLFWNFGMNQKLKIIFTKRNWISWMEEPVNFGSRSYTCSHGSKFLLLVLFSFRIYEFYSHLFIVFRSFWNFILSCSCCSLFDLV